MFHRCYWLRHNPRDFEEMDAIRIISIMANVAILAPLLGPLMGAVVIHYTSWRYIFVTIALGALIALWGLWRYMPEPIGQIKRNGELTPKAKFSAKRFLKTIRPYFLIKFLFCDLGSWYSWYSLSCLDCLITYYFDC